MTDAALGEGATKLLALEGASLGTTKEGAAPLEGTTKLLALEGASLGGAMTLLALDIAALDGMQQLQALLTGAQLEAATLDGGAVLPHSVGATLGEFEGEGLKCASCSPPPAALSAMLDGEIEMAGARRLRSTKRLACAIQHFRDRAQRAGQLYGKIPNGGGVIGSPTTTGHHVPVMPFRKTEPVSAELHPSAKSQQST